MSSGYHCQSCGEWHAELPRAWGVETPLPFLLIPPEERAVRCLWDAETCEIDGREFYVRGCLEIPVRDGSEPFSWGVWVSLSERSYQRTRELWTTPGREQEPPFFGWLCTALPLYPSTLSLKTLVHTRPVGKRPFVELEATDHPLAIEQREGITEARLQEIAGALLHGPSPGCEI
ncbi:MAG: DUF2199 domain-containing protein [Planctomycetaceae bacterium]|jgi:hypothetical protein